MEESPTIHITDIARSMEKLIKKTESWSNLTFSLKGIKGDRMIRSELNISSIDPPTDRDKVTQYTDGNTNTRVGDQNLYGPGPSVRNYYERSNLISSPTNFSGNRMIREELNLSSIGPSLDSVQVLNPYRVGLDLTVSQRLEQPNRYHIVDQIGIGFNDGLVNTGCQSYYHNGLVLDSYGLESDFFAYDNIGLSNVDFNCNLDQISTKHTDGLDNTAFQNNYCSGQVLESYRLDSDFPAGNQSRFFQTYAPGK